MDKSLVARIKEEFNRQIPEEYYGLIELGLGNPEETDALKKNSLFYAIEEPHAFFLQQWIEKNARIGLGALGLSRINTDEDNLTEFGILFKTIVKSKDFIDMGCGDPCPQNPAPIYALRFGAKRYIGADIGLTPEQVERYSKREGKFEQVYVNDEMLRFLASIPSPDRNEGGIILFFSAIESSFDFQNYLKLSQKKKPTHFELEILGEQKQRGEYHQALYREIERITTTGDAVVFGRRTGNLFPDYLLSKGFTKIDSSSTCDFYIKR